MLLVNFRNKYGSYVLPLIEFKYKTFSSHYIFTINFRGLKPYYADPSQLLNLSSPDFLSYWHNCNLPARLHLSFRSSILISVGVFLLSCICIFTRRISYFLISREAYFELEVKTKWISRKHFVECHKIFGTVNVHAKSKRNRKVEK